MSESSDYNNEHEQLRAVDAAQALARVDEEQTGEGGLSADQRDALCVLGYSFIQHRQTEKALTLFEALRALSPGDKHVERSLSYIYLTAQRYSDALEAADRAQQGESDGAGPSASAPTLLLRSRALWGLERADEARESLQQYIDATKLN